MAKQRYIVVSANETIIHIYPYAWEAHKWAKRHIGCTIYTIAPYAKYAGGKKTHERVGKLPRPANLIPVVRGKIER